MLPRLVPPLCWKLSALAIAGFVLSPALRAQDPSAVDPAKMLQQLHSLREQQSTQLKSDRGSVMVQIASAAASPDKAVALWEEAVRMTQFDGAGHESTQFQAWKAGDGEAFKEHEVQAALQLYFSWLQITLKRGSGMKVKDLLPEVINYAQSLAADQMTMDALDDAIKREKEMTAGRQPVRGAKPKDVIGLIKKIHDSILEKGLEGSTYVQWMRLMDWVNIEKWEKTPGNFDGIYEKVVLPEMRANRDPRLMDYWAMMMKKAADEANRTRLAFDVDKYNNIVLPSLLWGKYGDEIVLGQRNRALNEMFTLIKKYPAHPDAKEWVAQLETELVPPPAASPADPANPATSAAGVAPAPGVAAPGAVPPQ